MSNDRDSDPRPQRPRAEPEIIPPGRDRDPRGPEAIFVRVEERDGYRRIYLARPGLPTIILGLLILGLIAAVAFLVLAGLVLLWVPVLIGAILLALLSGTVRYRWRQFRAWWARRV